MAELGLNKARAIVRGALKHARANGLQPVAVAVLDAGGHLKAFEREDGASIYRFQVARGKAHGAVGLGIGGDAVAAAVARHAGAKRAVRQRLAAARAVARRRGGHALPPPALGSGSASSSSKRYWQCMHLRASAST